MRKAIGCALIICSIALFAADAPAKRRDVVRIPGGASIPKYGLALDASYDPRFDTLVPGYKVVQVAIVNNSFNIISLDPDKDRWVVHTVEGRKRFKAMADLRRGDPRAWRDLPEDARKLIAYPLLLPIGARQVIDLFVPDNAPLETLKQVDVDIKSLDVKFQVIARN
jgi:hypothetical protein